MSSAGEAKIRNAAVPKPVKEKKTKDPKEKKSKTAKTTSHPPYFQMIKEALLALNEKGGSSPYAIGKYMESKHMAVLPENFKKMLALQLKNSASKGKLTKVKASYKLSEKAKKEKSPAAGAGKKPTVVVAKKTKSKKPAVTVKSTPAKKKMTPAKKRKMTLVKGKQPKTIKSPAAKRARKATA